MTNVVEEMLTVTLSYSYSPNIVGHPRVYVYKLHRMHYSMQRVNNIIINTNIWRLALGHILLQTVNRFLIWRLNECWNSFKIAPFRG